MAQVAEVDRGTEVWLPVASSAVSIDPGVWGLGKRLNQAKQRLDGLIRSILMLPAQLSLLSQSGWGRAGPVPPLLSCFQLCRIEDQSEACVPSSGLGWGPSGSGESA